ncbi:MAG: hypothetical protein R6X12_05675 [bacterium]
MRGPYMLRPLQVDMSVPCRLGGVFGLGKDSRHVRLVGFAGHNVREAIKAHCGEYEFFWFEASVSPRDAFVRVCRHYHGCMDNGGLDAGDHPVAPAGVSEKCPVCGK